MRSAPTARRKTTVGTVFAAALLGIAEVFEGRKREDPPVVETAPGGDGDPIDLFLGDDPRDAVAIVKARP